MTRHESLHARARQTGAHPLVYWLVRAIIEPAFGIWFRMERIGAEHAPRSGPVIWASNHRSFLDPFILGCTTSRPLYYVAKQELFSHRFVGWLLNALGAFPVARGAGDPEMFETAKAILARGDAVLIFPEGTRVRPGPLRRARRGVGRLALETGAPVLPVAIIGTEDVRRGWRIRPHKVRVRFGPALHVPRVAPATPALAQAVTERVWACVRLQWESLGGAAPMTRTAVLDGGALEPRPSPRPASAGADVDSELLAGARRAA